MEEHEAGLALPSHQGEDIHQNMLNSLYAAVANRRAHEYWISKGRYTEGNKDNINWIAQGKALRSTKSGRKRTITKWVSHWIGTGKIWNDGTYDTRVTARIAIEVRRILCTYYAVKTTKQNRYGMMN